MAIRPGPFTGAVVVIVSMLVLVGVVAGSTGGPERPPMVNGYGLPDTIADGHFVLGIPPAVAPSISADKVIDLAIQYAGELASNAKDASVQYVLFTDRNRGMPNADGSVKLEFENVPAWIVRFRGVPQPMFGGFGSRVGVQAEELNVVIDAETGAYVEMFSFK